MSWAAGVQRGLDKEKNVFNGKIAGRIGSSMQLWWFETKSFVRLFINQNLSNFYFSCIAKEEYSKLVKKFQPKHM